LTATSTTRVLSRFIAGFNYEDLSKEAIKEVKRHTLDTLGDALGAYGYKIKPVNITLNLIKSMGGREESTIIGDGGKVPCPNATLINTYQSQVLEYNDTHPDVAAHAGQNVVNSSLAVAEREKVTGRDLITAIALGYEVEVRVGLGISGLWGAGAFKHIHIQNTPGPTAAASKLLRLNEDQMVDAFGISMARSLISSEWIYEDTGYGLWSGMAARDAVMAVLLAREGKGGPEMIIDGKSGIAQLLSTKYDINKVVEGLGKTSKVSETWFKYHASGHGSHTSIDAALEVMKKHRINKDEIEEITVRASPKLSNAFDPIDSKRKPVNPQAAMFSVPYCVAVAVLRGKVTSDDFTKEAIIEPERLNVANKVSFIPDPEFPQWAVTLTFKMKDHQLFSAHVDYPKGSTKNPVTDRELEDKFEFLASKTLSNNKVQKIISIVDHLEELGSVSELMELVKKD